MLDYEALEKEIKESCGEDALQRIQLNFENNIVMVTLHTSIDYKQVKMEETKIKKLKPKKEREALLKEKKRSEIDLWDYPVESIACLNGKPIRYLTDADDEDEISLSSSFAVIRRYLDRRAYFKRGFDYFLTTDSYQEIDKRVNEEYDRLVKYYYDGKKDKGYFRMYLNVNPFPRGSSITFDNMTNPNLVEDIKLQCKNLVLEIYDKIKRSITSGDDINSMEFRENDDPKTWEWYYLKVQDTYGKERVGSAVGLKRLSPSIWNGIKIPKPIPPEENNDVKKIGGLPSLLNKAETFYQLTNDKDIKNAIDKIHEIIKWVQFDELKRWESLQDKKSNINSKESAIKVV